MCNLRHTFDNVERHSITWRHPVLDETSLPQRLTAEFLGTAFLVFVGVGAVPATLIVNGDSPFTMADLGMISLAFARSSSPPSTRSATSAATTSTPRSPSGSP
jgi:hypothetical protein